MFFIFLVLFGTVFTFGQSVPLAHRRADIRNSATPPSVAAEPNEKYQDEVNTRYLLARQTPYDVKMEKSERVRRQIAPSMGVPIEVVDERAPLNLIDRTGGIAARDEVGYLSPHKLFPYQAPATDATRERQNVKNVDASSEICNEIGDDECYKKLAYIKAMDVKKQVSKTRITGSGLGGYCSST